MHTRFRRTSDLEDIDEAIYHLDEASKCQPENYDNQAFLHFRRGVLYQDRADASGEPEGLENTVLSFLDGFDSAGTLSTRLGCGYRALMICGALEQFFAGYLRCSVASPRREHCRAVIRIASVQFLPCHLLER